MATLDTETVRTHREEFQLLFTELADYFRFKTSGKVFDMYYRSVKFYPHQAIKEIVDNMIFTGKPIPSMFPSIQTLVDQCAGWLNGRPTLKQSMTSYEEYRDEDFPIEIINNACRILEAQGVGSFTSYCKSKHMPLQDIERVLCKANYNGDIDAEDYSKTIRGLDLRYELINRKRAQGDETLIPILGKTVKVGAAEDLKSIGRSNQ